MNKMNQRSLADSVQISPQYQRSIRVDADVGREDALSAYICNATASTVIDGMCKQLIATNQRSFTWTGPFGGGKSSLAVALASALHPNVSLRAKARKSLGVSSKSPFDKAFPVQKGWLIVPTVGRRGSIVAALHSALRCAQGKQVDRRSKPNAQSIISDLLSEAKQRPTDGVIVIIDEMGKFLEASALGSGDDVYFFQELAESAARSEGRLVVVGILHQSFAQYSARMGIDTRDDWVKVQGRYVDLPFVAASDEVVELIGQAIESKNRPDWVRETSHAVADSIRARRPAVGHTFAESLEACWPLHPVMAALLGPISKRQFGQNERSVFGFLSSVEPSGFRTFLNSTPENDESAYCPHDYWDYLRSNLEPAILASPDGHRWSQAVEAIDRAETRTSDRFLVSLIKNIAVIDLFRNGSGLSADKSIIRSLYSEKSEDEIESALSKLSDLKVVLYKNYTSAWSVFEGSDFDINAAIAQTLATTVSVDYARLEQVMGMHPVVAKRHYHETGSMRWMELSICSISQAEKISISYSPQKGEFGKLIIALPSKGMTLNDAHSRARTSSKLSPWPVIVGIPSNHTRISELSAELFALEQVKDRHELSGDSVARREVYARLTAARVQLEDQLQAAVSLAKWHDGTGDTLPAGVKLSPFASQLADSIYDASPHVWSELVNRDIVSSSSVKARRDLLHAMVNSETRETLGFEGFPAERGLYETLLRSTGLHRNGPFGAWRFAQPSADSAACFGRLWAATQDLFSAASLTVSVSEIYSTWSEPPFGLKRGIQPIVLTAFLLSHKSNIAIYKDGIFVPRLSDFDVDECLQDPNRFSLRWIAIDSDKSRILEGISELLSELGENTEAAGPLEIARGLVAMLLNLPEWTRRTSRLGATSRDIRDILLKANDPHKLLFVDLATLLKAEDGEAYVSALRAPLEELSNAYEKMLTEVADTMLRALDATRDDPSALRERARALAGISGDLQLDGFVTRLVSFDGSRVSLEGLLSLAAERPPRDWVDRHIDTAILELAKFARRFRESEAYASVKGREAHSEAIAVVIGAGSNTETISRSFVIPRRHKRLVEDKANEVALMLRSQGLDSDLLLAILAKAGSKLLTTQPESEND